MIIQIVTFYKMSCCAPEPRRRKRKGNEEVFLKLLYFNYQKILFFVQFLYN